MKKIYAILLLTGILLGCEKDGATEPAANRIISTSFLTADTLGNPGTIFQRGTPFYLTFTMTNKTGKDQPFIYGGPISEIYISRNDTIISRQYDGLAWVQVVNHGVLKADSTLTNRWLGPFNPLNPSAALMPGSYMADIFINAGFDNAEIERPQGIQITIIDTSHVVVRKPNIYLYPKTTLKLSVSLEFPLGGSVLQSIPLYSNGWYVSVEPSGKIDQQYNYLFYESKNPDSYQYTSGWIVNRDTIRSFFSSNLLFAGFNQNEKNDFIEYWIPRLTGYSYYIIYPQFSGDIEKVIRLKISKQPDSMLRLFYVIQGTNDSRKLLPAPSIPRFERNGFVVAEWGVILK